MRCPPYDASGITSTRYVVTKTLPAFRSVQVAFDTTSFAGRAVSIVAYAARFTVPFSFSRYRHFTGSASFNHLYKKKMGQKWAKDGRGKQSSLGKKHIGLKKYGLG